MKHRMSEVIERPIGSLTASRQLRSTYWPTRTVHNSYPQNSERLVSWEAPLEQAGRRKLIPRPSRIL